MTWATAYIERLKRGETVQFRPRGNSMQPRIESGQLVTVVPATNLTPLEAGTAVLCRCEGRDWLHMIKARRVEGGSGRILYQIGNNKGHVNGWTSRENIFGVVTEVEP